MVFPFEPPEVPAARARRFKLQERLDLDGVMRTTVAACDAAGAASGHYDALATCVLRAEAIADLPGTPAQVTKLHCVALHCVALRCIALHRVALCCIALRCIALHCVALHCIALHCVALRCIALHCILRCIRDLPDTLAQTALEQRVRELLHACAAERIEPLATEAAYLLDVAAMRSVADEARRAAYESDATREIDALLALPEARRRARGVCVCVCVWFPSVTESGAPRL